MPTRHFVVVDPSGLYADAIDAGLERLRQRRLLRELSGYVERHMKNRDTIDLEQTQGLSVENLLDDIAERNPDAVDQGIRSGAIDQVLDKVRPFLRPDAPPFEEPKSPFVRVPLPADVGAESRRPRGPSRRAETLLAGRKDDRRRRCTDPTLRRSPDSRRHRCEDPRGCESDVAHREGSERRRVLEHESRGHRAQERDHGPDHRRVPRTRVRPSRARPRGGRGQSNDSEFPSRA